ncbi:unnamed protein product [Mycena citricolor]|uniref:DUF6699 domain-containing protein n=1 Tax=Mycena citricolor TaxID=2018698 RepID=A0AAD2HWC8_9AGAR|nr:unnamed protein product [Mycena citricolor]
MSAPYVYNPQAEHFPPFRWQATSSCWPRAYGQPCSANTPHAPSPPATIYPPSPYASPQQQPVAESPFISGLNGPDLFGSPYQHSRQSPIQPFIPPLSPFAEPISRAPSWPGAPPSWSPPSTPFAAAATPVIAGAPIITGAFPATPFAGGPYGTPYPALVQSFSGAPFANQPLPGIYPSNYGSFPGQIQIHPSLSSDTCSRIILFDLSYSAFLPQKLVSPGSEDTVHFSMSDIQAQAFYPGVNRLRIVCDMTPDLPIELAYPLGGQGPPISVGDVLIAIHQQLHKPISSEDWEALSSKKEARVSRAFTRRCRQESIRCQTGYKSDCGIHERQKGVKFVDFLQGKTMFRGLVKTDDGLLKLVVADP